MSVPALPDPFASGLALIRELEQAGAISPVHLDLSSRPDLPLESCMALASLLGQVNDGSRWWIADLYEFVEARYGEYVSQVMDATGLAASTIENIISIGRKVPPSRRRIGVHFSTHAEVAALTPNEQRHWLKIAADERLTKAELRGRVRPVLPLAGVKMIQCPECGHEFSP